MFFALFTLGYALAQNTISIRIDDSELYTPANQNGIQYSSSWVQHSGNEAKGQYRGTFSSTSTANASAIFFFQGSSVSSYYVSGNGYVSIDGRPAQQMNESPWTESDLDDEDHQIVISQPDSSGAKVLELDYFEVVYNVREHPDVHPSSIGPGGTHAPQALIIDNTDKKIKYEGTWTNSPPDVQRSFYFGGTQHTTTTPGSSLSFTFNGTAISYFSDQRAENGWALISVDGDEGERVSTFLPFKDRRWFSQVLCWSKTDLKAGTHVIKISHDDKPGSHVSLDFFKYTPSSGSDFSQLQAKHISLAAVVGLAGAGVAIVCGAWVLFWLHRYHRGTRNEATPDISDKSETSSIADRTFGPVPQAPAATPAGRAWSGFGESRRASPCESHHTVRPPDVNRDPEGNV
ncbi:Transmembrane protein [Ceratobasidium theobromae]|uniref:Transmembrane protein n=1 Tax=Ceratobasidium theobromae TaxID=1582974 RepID=A0A5N5QGD6_9AGAM|nr:Transmembrane protein [Ceratobasidium theobromae]